MRPWVKLSIHKCNHKQNYRSPRPQARHAEMLFSLLPSPLLLTLLLWCTVLPQGRAIVDHFPGLGRGLGRLFQGGADHVSAQVRVLQVGHACYPPVCKALIDRIDQHHWQRRAVAFCWKGLQQRQIASLGHTAYMLMLPLWRTYFPMI